MNPTGRQQSPRCFLISKPMKYAAIQNTSRPIPQPILARYCSSFLCQLRGLMFRRSLPPYHGLLLVQGRDSRLDSSIHMLFMWMDLTVVWINTAGEIVDVRLAKRWRPAYVSRRPARYVLEMPVEYGKYFQVGEKVRIDEAWLD